MSILALLGGTLGEIGIRLVDALVRVVLVAEHILILQIIAFERHIDLNGWPQGDTPEDISNVYGVVHLQWFLTAITKRLASTERRFAMLLPLRSKEIYDDLWKLLCLVLGSWGLPLRVIWCCQRMSTM